MSTASVQLTIKAFGITREIFGGRELKLDFSGQTVGDLRKSLLERYPSLTGLKSLMIAVNNEYAEDDQSLSGGEEIAVIPPVSGG